MRGKILSIVFVAGLAVMAVEMTATRLLAPYFGSSLYVWTNVVAVVLISLALGYGGGGRLADRTPPALLISKIRLALFAAGVWTLLVPVFLRPAVALAALGVSGGSVVWPSLAASFLLFAAPLACAALITPLASRAMVTDAAHVGRPVGDVFLVSTLGSLIGTFLPVLVTIPRLGTRGTFFLFGSLLAAVGAWGGRKRWMLLLALAGLLAWREHREAKPANVLWEGDSVYQHLKVVRYFDGSLALEVNEGRGMQSYYRSTSAWTGYYWDYAALLPAINADGRDYLFLGVGGGTSARLVHSLFPDVRLEGVEIDPQIAELGRLYFGLADVPMEVSIGDARVFLEKSSKSYDFLMVDVYRDNRAIPPHLATREFFDAVRRRLSPRGALIMNVSTPRGGERLLSVIRNTLASSFRYVYEMRGPAGARLLFGFVERPTLLAGGMTPVVFDPSETVATDDRSPVEVLAVSPNFHL